MLCQHQFESCVENVKMAVESTVYQNTVSSHIYIFCIVFLYEEEGVLI